MATIATVVPDTPITSAWGNSVANELNNNCAKKSGATFTGAVLLPSPQSTNAAAAVRYDFHQTGLGNKVDKSGATMTGLLTIDPAGDNCLRLLGTSPLIDFFDEPGAVRRGYLQGTTAGMYLRGENNIAFAAANNVLINKAATDPNVAGVEIEGSGSGRVTITTATTTAFANIVARHTGAADAPGEVYAHWQRSTLGTTAGAITQGSGNNVVYGTTSDYRLKNVVGPIVDAVQRLGNLAPKRITWKDDLAAGESDGFVAHEVAVVVPEAVTGTKDAVNPPDHPYDPGGIAAQQLDAAKLVPLLVAAVQELTARIVILETTIGGAAA